MVEPVDTEPSREGRRVFVVSMGLVTSAGVGTEPFRRALRRRERCFEKLSLFSRPTPPALVAEVPDLPPDQGLPRTHVLALAAAREAIPDGAEPPDAIVLGGTTGGIATTEELLRQGVTDGESYRWHGLGTVADVVAQEVGCGGRALTVATACSSGATALLVALEMMRRGEARRVLAGGVDCLCRLTYCGFDMLKLLDAEGARPFDEKRQGMTVGEGAAFFVLAAGTTPPERALAEIRGGGLSCDAYHPSAPDPDGRGALKAMESALADAGLSAQEVTYCCLHGTGTAENDGAEARAVRRLWPEGHPPMSSIKGSLGHTVGASGALQAAAATVCLQGGFIPGTAGCTTADPALEVDPAIETIPDYPVKAVLANAFGFGGNNAALVLTSPENSSEVVSSSSGAEDTDLPTWTVRGAACLTSAGATDASLEAWTGEAPLAGLVPPEALNRPAGHRRLGRLKRLPRLALALAAELQEEGSDKEEPQDETTQPCVEAVFAGTSWGALSETYDFLSHLYETEEQFSSPTDFVGTVHNGPAGQVAQWLKATGPNITTSSGPTSFEDALYVASLFSGKLPGLVMVAGFDEGHDTLSPRVDRATAAGSLSDGGGALLLEGGLHEGGQPILSLVFQGATDQSDGVERAVDRLGGVGRMAGEIGEVWFGYPADEQEEGLRQEALLRSTLGENFRFIDYRARCGQYGTVTATATALAAARVLNGDDDGTAGAARDGFGAHDVSPRGIVLFALGKRVTALRLVPAELDGSPFQRVVESTREGYRLFKADRISEAEAVFKDVVAQDGDNSYGLVGLGDCGRKDGRFREALAFYERCLATSPSNRFAQFGRADCLHKLGRHKAAAAAWEDYLLLEGSRPLILTRAADAHRKSGDLRRATELYQAALEQDEGNAYALTGLGYTLNGKQDYAGAAACWEQLYAAAPEQADVRLLTCLGNSYRRMKRFRQGAKFFRQALEKEEDNGYALFGMADCCRGRHLMDEAVALWERLLAQEPNNLAVLTRLGDAYRRSRRYELADERYRRALEIRQDDIFALLGMARLQLQRRKPAEALVFAEQLLEARGPHHRAYLVAADCLLALGQHDRVRELVARARQAGIHHRGLEAKAPPPDDEA